MLYILDILNYKIFGDLAEWSKASRSGRDLLSRREFEPHNRQNTCNNIISNCTSFYKILYIMILYELCILLWSFIQTFLIQDS